MNRNKQLLLLFNILIILILILNYVNASVRVPYIEKATVSMGDTKLYLNGEYLNTLEFSIDSIPLFVNVSNYVDVDLTSANTYGYFELKEAVNSPLVISVNNTVYHSIDKINVFILTCMKPDCSGNGICNSTSLQCICSQGWGGTDCSIDQTYQCVNNCNGHGTCSIDMVCNCDKDYTGVSCNNYSPDIGLSMSMNSSKNEPSIKIGSFGTNSSNKSMQLNEYTKSSEYSILIPYIQEIDFTGNLVKNYTFTEESWSFLGSDSNNRLIYFSTLSIGSNITVIIETILDATTREWAGQLLNLPDHSIKYSVLIRNYTFSSNLNTLQLIYQASPTSKLSLECEIKQSIAWGAKRSTDMHWVTLPNNQVSLYGRFSNNVIVDNRIVSTSNEGLEFGTTIQVKVNIPFFSDFVELDPDFSVLVNNDLSPNQYDECGIKIKKSSSRKWVVPVAVVVSVVGAAIIVTALISILYSKNTTLRTKMLAFKSKFNRNHSNRNVSMKGL